MFRSEFTSLPPDQKIRAQKFLPVSHWQNALVVLLQVDCRNLDDALISRTERRK